MRFLFIASLLSAAAALPAIASNPNEGLHEGIHLLPLDPDFPAEAIKVPEIRVHPFGEEMSTELLPAGVQARLLKSSELELVEEWDSFDRDRFFLRAENQPSAEVAARYPGAIEPAKIARLRAGIAEYRQAAKRREEKR